MLQEQNTSDGCWPRYLRRDRAATLLFVLGSISAPGRTRTSGVSLWVIYSHLSSPLDHRRVSWSGGIRTLNIPVNSRTLYHWATDQSMWRVSNPPVLIGSQMCRHQHFTCMRIKEVPGSFYPIIFLNYRIAAEWIGVVTIHPVRIFSPSLIHLSYLSSRHTKGPLQKNLFLLSGPNFR